MKSIKKITLGVLALASLISVLFITSSPSSSPAQAQTTAVAQRASVLIAFIDITDDSATSIPPIFTIEWVGDRCDSKPLGGTVHRIAGTTGNVALGVASQGSEHIETHFNTDQTSQSSNGAQICEYTLTVTASLLCTFVLTDTDAAMTAAGSNTLISVDKDDFSVNEPSQGSTKIRGKSFGNTPDDDFFTPSNDASLTPLPEVPASGILEADTSAAGDSYVDIVAAGATSVFNTFALAATECDAPQATRGFSITNAEPEGSLELSVNLETQNETCTPSGDIGELTVFAGRPERPRDVALDSTCPVEATLGHASAQTINLQTNALRAQCGVSAALYVVDESNAFTLGSEYVIVTDAESMRDALDFGFRSGTGFVEYDEQTISRITLFVTTSCPQIASFEVAYDIKTGTDQLVGQTPVQVTVVPTEGSAEGCTASPAVATVAAASNFDTTTVASAGDTATLTAIDTDLTQTVRINIVSLPRTGRACSYVISFPRKAGALSLLAEPGYTRDALDTTGSEFRAAADGLFDGSITRNSLNLGNLSAPLTFVYETRELDISVTMIFPDDVIFTTQDQVRYRISVTGFCARYIPIIARALGNSGTFRSVQAYGGITQVFNRDLQEIESDDSQAGPLLYSVPPVIIIDQDTNPRTVPCSVQVEELLTPAGCSILGDNPRELTFGEGELDAFDFTFEHTCAGLPTIDSGRGITG